MWYTYGYGQPVNKSWFINSHTEQTVQYFEVYFTEDKE